MESFPLVKLIFTFGVIMAVLIWQWFSINRTIRERQERERREAEAGPSGPAGHPEG